MKKRVLFIIAQEGFRDEELLVPRQILEAAGIEVVVASISTEPALGKLGAKVLPDIAVKDADLADYDMILMVGGPGAPELANYDEVKDIFVRARSEEKPFGAICIAPMNLARFGVLEDKRATVFKDDEAISALEEGGARYTGKDVEVDGNIVTADGPFSAEKFAKAVVKLLNSRD
ncbi:MAG: DJ-1/PfpI family protein [Nanoarchaeota archaeon]